MAHTRGVNETRTPPDHLSIGEFARHSRLTLKALRLYDEMGLLAPAYVDPDSSYRYYLPSQLGRAKLIGLLRQLEMPLQTIREVLALSGPEASRKIGSYWREVEGGLQVKRNLVRYLEDYLEAKGEAMFPVETRRVPEQKILTLQGRVHARDLPDFIREHMDQLYAYIPTTGAQPSGPSLVIYHGQVDDDSDGPVEVCAPFTGSLEPAGAMHIRLEPAHTEAYTRLTKEQVEFPGILRAYDAVAHWLKANDRQRAGSPREVYFDNWSQGRADDPACDIAWPCSEA